MILSYASLRLEVFEPGLLLLLLAAPMSSGLLLTQHLRPWETPRRSQIAAIAVWLGAGTLAWMVTQQLAAIAIALVALGLTWSLKRSLRHFFVTGQLMMTSLWLTPLLGMGWGLSFIHTAVSDPLLRSLMIATLGLGAIALGLDLLMVLPSQAYLYRKRWMRPRLSLPPLPRLRYPKVSIHVPCHAEPPDIVCETLQILNQLKYPNYEVLVIDNNTSDPTLWQPVQDFCQGLGEKFRFFHVENLPGAKGGALNYALGQLDDDVELVAVVDADYHAEPNFLERLVGYFDDPKLGFIQTPHDYRGWQGNFYQTACYWEYLLYFRIHLSCLNEWMASHIAGTMCIIRREALDAAGGWAEWCLTEDSESAVRIHALGYSSIFIRETFGRGLIPENYERLKKQRLRWIMGPVQQLKRHWPLYFGKPLGVASRLTRWQRLIEFAHGLDGVRPVFRLVGVGLSLAVVVLLIQRQEAIAIPRIAWIALGVTVPVSLVNQGLTFYLLGCRSLRAMVGVLLVSSSFDYARYVGCFKVLLTWKPLAWIRTSKFSVLPNRLQAIRTTLPEIILAMMSFAIAFLLATHASVHPPDLVAMVAIGFVVQGFRYGCAPLLALLAEQELWKVSPERPKPHADWVTVPKVTDHA